MPTVAGPVHETHPVLFNTGRGQPDVAGHLEAIRLDFAELGIPFTPLNVLARALDAGVPEAIAVEIAALVPAHS